MEKGEERGSKRSKQSLPSLPDVVLTSNPLYDVQLSAAAQAAAPAEPSLASTIGDCDALIEGAEHPQHQPLGAVEDCPLGAGPEDEEDAFSEFAVSPLRSATPPLPAAFAAALQAPMVYAALFSVEVHDRHPVGQGTHWATLEATLAAMLALAGRAALVPAELSPPMLLTLLWMAEAWHSQYRDRIKDVLPTYLLHHRLSPAATKKLKRDMRALQFQVLCRCDWRMPFDIVSMETALAELASEPHAAELCEHIREQAYEQKARVRQQREAAAAAAARARARAAVMPAAPVAVRPARRSLRSLGCLDTELDGRYWTQQ